MKSKGLSVVLVAVAAMVVFWAKSSSKTIAKPTPAPGSPTALQGDWVVSEHAITSITDTEFAAAVLSITSSAVATIDDGNGGTQTLTFQSSEPDENGFYQLLVNNGEDSDGMGGGGSRKAIAQLDENDDLEIVEATSAEDDYPPDFSAGTKAVSISWKLTPQ